MCKKLKSLHTHWWWDWNRISQVGNPAVLFFRNMYTLFTYSPAIPLLEKWKICPHQRLSYMFIAAEKENDPLPISQWKDKNKIWYMCTRTCSGMKHSQVLGCAWMNLENIWLKEAVHQWPHIVVSFEWNTQNRMSRSKRSEMGEWWWEASEKRGSEERTMTANKCRVSRG